MKTSNIRINAPWGYVALLVVLSITILNASDIVITILWLLVLAMCLLEGMKLRLWLGPDQRPKVAGPSVKSKVSVHLAICNEPPKMVIATIKGVLAQGYSNFELIIVDNNTKDENVWSPVRDFCEDHDNIRFFHLEKWPFYKSGALNFARKVTDPEVDFVFVLDADYMFPYWRSSTIFSTTTALTPIPVTAPLPPAP